MAAAVLSIEDLSKTFLLHVHGGVRLDVFSGVSFDVGRGECVVVDGPSGSGKASLLRCLYGNDLARSGRIWIDDPAGRLDICAVAPERIIKLRRNTIGYVSQFFRCVPRVAALDVVAEPLTLLGRDTAAACTRAGEVLGHVAINERLWSLAPATFPGGEQQRINVARAFVVDFPILLLDEPTASLDLDNCRRVVSLINAAKACGAAIVGIFHDRQVRSAVADRTVDISAWRTAA